jgi:hypothetical protein
VSVAAVIAIAVWILVAVSGGSSKHAAPPRSVTSAPNAAPTSRVASTITSQEGHFTARFPVQPVEKTVPLTSSGEPRMQVAVCLSPITLVGSEIGSTPISADQYQNIMRVAVSSSVLPVSPKLVHVAITKFRGFPGRTATYVTGSGAQFTMVLFSYSPTRVYVLMAASGAAIDALEGSFIPLA